MRRQGSFSQAEYAEKKKETRRDKFLTEMAPDQKGNNGTSG